MKKSTITLGQLKEIKDLRKIWQNEAQDFTPWLEQNVSKLGDTLGIDIVITERESAVGDFNVDLFAYDEESGRKIIIENQLEDTNHDHLGKLITYASGKDASLIVWVVRHAREEHRAAIEWLNNHTDDEVGFILCEIKVFQIDDSVPAVKFEVIERPNNWARTMKRAADSTVRTNLPKIRDMLDWGAVKEGDVLVAKGTDSEAVLQADGKVMVGSEIMSIHQWLQSVYGWTSVETYVFAVQKKSGRSLADIREEYMTKFN